MTTFKVGDYVFNARTNGYYKVEIVPPTGAWLVARSLHDLRGYTFTSSELQVVSEAAAASGHPQRTEKFPQGSRVRVFANNSFAPDQIGTVIEGAASKGYATVEMKDGAVFYYSECELSFASIGDAAVAGAVSAGASPELCYALGTGVLTPEQIKERYGAGAGEKYGTLLPSEFEKKMHGEMLSQKPDFTKKPVIQPYSENPIGIKWPSKFPAAHVCATCGGDAPLGSAMFAVNPEKYPVEWQQFCQPCALKVAKYIAYLRDYPPARKDSKW